MNKALLALAIGGFGIGLTEFVIMGILPEVALDLNISIPRAGHFISAYALGVVVGAPTLSSLGNKWPAHKVLLFLMALFTLFNTLSAAAWNYESLLVMRFLSGLPHGAFFGIGAVVATRLVNRNRAGSAIAMLFVGFTVANIFGVPFGTYLGQELAWSYSFVLVGVVGVAAVLAIHGWVPALPQASGGSFLSDIKILRNSEIWLVVLLCIIGSGSFFAWYSYISPLITEVAGHPKYMVGIAMTLAGIGMALGNLIGAWLADRFTPIRAILVIQGLIVVCLLANGLLAHNKVMILVMTFTIGIVCFSMSAPVQLMMIQTARGSETLGSSINQSAFNIGNAMGAYIAGIPIALGYGFASADFVGAFMAFLGVLVAAGIFVLQRKRANAHPVPAGEAQSD